MSRCWCRRKRSRSRGCRRRCESGCCRRCRSKRRCWDRRRSVSSCWCRCRRKRSRSCCRGCSCCCCRRCRSRCACDRGQGEIDVTRSVESKCPDESRIRNYPTAFSSGIARQTSDDVVVKPGRRSEVDECEHLSRLKRPRPCRSRQG